MKGRIGKWLVALMTMVLLLQVVVVGSASAEKQSPIASDKPGEAALAVTDSRGLPANDEERGVRTWYRLDKATGQSVPLTWAEVQQVYPQQFADMVARSQAPEAQKSDGSVVATGVCVRVPWGPGKVNWKMSDPKSLGFSVKPETATNLIWAKAPSQDIDGVYKSSWGSCNAQKVPDHCTVDWLSSTSYSTCCNAAASVVGGTVRFTNTCSGPEAGWPDDPLR